MSFSLNTKFLLRVCLSVLFLVLCNMVFFRFELYSQTQQERIRSTDGEGIEKGMVMCVGNDPNMVAGALYMIQQLRETWQSLLPVSVNHCNELPALTQASFTKFRNVTIKNICGPNTPKSRRVRLKGWFCKTMALIISDYSQTIVVDTDVLWFKDPSHLFNAPGYMRSGALFFRDRFLHVSDTEKDGLEVDKVTLFIEQESESPRVIDSISALSLSKANGVNFFWRHSANSTESKAIRHVQESSVIVMDRNRLPRTISVLSRLLETFKLGYGDKEIYWIAATVAGEDFSFEPYLAGSYGDCGEILHFDPFSSSLTAAPYFINCQYLAEGIDHVGKNVQSLISRPVIATASTAIFNMGDKDKKTAGRCGSCKAMGCDTISPSINKNILDFQAYQLKHTKLSTYQIIKRKISTFIERLFDY